MTTSFDARTALQLDETAQDLLFREARSANAFTNEPVTDEQLRAIYDLVKWAPTSMNNQPLRIVVLRSEEAKARLLPHLAEGNRAKTAAAPAVALLAADVDFHDELPRLFPTSPVPVTCSQTRPHGSARPSSTRACRSATPSSVSARRVSPPAR